MKRKELTKIFMMFSTWKKRFVHKYFSFSRVKRTIAVKRLNFSASKREVHAKKLGKLSADSAVPESVRWCAALPGCIASCSPRMHSEYLSQGAQSPSLAPHSGVRTTCWCGARSSVVLSMDDAIYSSWPHLLCISNRLLARGCTDGGPEGLLQYEMSHRGHYNLTQLLKQTRF